MRAYLFVGTALALIAGSQASAQTARTTDAPSSAAASSEQANPQQGIEDIVVTAQRQRENLQRAAVAVDVVRGADLVTAGITQIDRLDQLTPALTTQTQGTGAIFFLRGVGNFAVAVNSDPAIAFSYDGIYVARPTSITGLFFDLERLEVLKGPQGTLYGRNATGGAINAIPVQPKIGALEGYATGSYGNYDTKTLEGAINVPLGEDGAIRVAGSIARHDGYLDDGTRDQRDSSLRVQMKAALTPRLTARISADYSHAGGVGFGSTYLGAYNFNAVTRTYSLTPSGLPRSEGYFTPAAQNFFTSVKVAGRNLNPLAPYPFQGNNFYGANAEISYDTDVGTLTVVPGWRYASLNYLVGVVDLRDQEKDEQYSTEVRFAGKRIGIFDYTIGGYYFKETIHQRLALNLYSAISLSASNYYTESEAAFGRITAHLSDKLRLVGGLRYSNDDKNFDTASTSGVLICPSPAGCPRGILFPLVTSPADVPFNFPAASGATVLQTSGGIPTGLLVARTDGQTVSQLSNSRVTYRAAIEYDIFPRSLFYASYETGYRSGGFNSAAGFETYQPEYINAFTVGLKNRFLDNRLQLNLEGFYWKYRDQQVSHIGLDLNGRTANYTQNIGRSRIWGGEAEVSALVTPTTLLSADIQYLNTKDLSFAFQQAVPTAFSPPPLSGCAVAATGSPVLYNVDCGGKPAFNSPRWTLNLAGQQTVPLNTFKLVFGVDTQFKTRRVVGFEYLPEEYVGSTWQTNAHISFGPANDRWSITAFVHNLENNRVITGTAIHPTANILTAQVTEPRLYGVRAGVKF
ncbi:MAG: TonB-dependent receptor [Bradyrhizobium sp.]|nr:TonB-dependent receptor [Bradyrhizobium sp.]